MDSFHCFGIKFIYSEKATKFCKISTVDLTVTTKDKSKVVISQNFCVLLTIPQLYGGERFVGKIDTVP